MIGALFIIIGNNMLDVCINDCAVTDSIKKLLFENFLRLIMRNFKPKETGTPYGQQIHISFLISIFSGLTLWNVTIE
jgi:hypothetical protein